MHSILLENGGKLGRHLIMLEHPLGAIGNVIRLLRPNPSLEQSLVGGRVERVDK
jgi:hypothetical protein